MKRMKVMIGLLSALTLFYAAGLAQRSWVLLADPGWLPKLFGALILLFPALAVWSVFVEVRFGMATERLAKQLSEYPELETGLEYRPSGRATKASAEAALIKAQARLTAAPNEWQNWLLVAIIADAAGDRKAARSAARKAISIEKRKVQKSLEST
jgi:hypothetical protein